MNTKRLAQWLGAAVLATGAALITAGPASAAPALPPGGCTAGSGAVGITSPIHFGQLVDMSNWGGGGSAATACTGAVINDRAISWHTPGAGVAADFTFIPVTGLNAAQQAKCTASGSPGCFLLEYTPGNAQSGLALSSILNEPGTYMRDRVMASSVQDGSAGHAVNEWQDFAKVPTGDGFYQLETVLSTSGFVGSVNIKGGGGNGSQIISWFPIGASGCVPGQNCATNEIFETVAAP